jgi:polyisoprenoid-binding protein YceI
MTSTTAHTISTVGDHGSQLPARTVWEIDPGHADVAFVGRHFMMTKVRGRFTDVAGVIRIGESMADASVDVTIGTASVESGNATRDDHIRSAELFDVATYPTATFRSTAVEWAGDHGVVHGDLTIHGVTRNVPLQVTFEGQVRDPWGGHRAMFAGRTTVNREDFGVTWNVALEAGGVLVSKEIQIEIDLETVRLDQ